MLLLILFFALMFITIAAMLWSGVELFREQEDPLGDRLVDLQAHAMVGEALAAMRQAADTVTPAGVRDLPDRRAVRWYTTTGLVDRPAMQGRTALYSPRHLLQVVAVKRRQAEGRSLAEVQSELTGATDDTLREVRTAMEMDVVSL